MAPIEAWEQLTDRIRGNNPSLYALLSECGLASLADDRLKLLCKPGGVGWGQLANPTDYRDDFEAVIKLHLDGSMQFEIAAGEPSQEFPSLTMIQAERRAKRQAAVDRQASEEPVIQELVQTFAAQVRETRPL